MPKRRSPFLGWIFLIWNCTEKFLSFCKCIHFVTHERQVKLSLILFNLLILYSDVLREVDMPVAIVSHLPRGDLDVVLNATGLVDYFPVDKRVSLDDSYQSERSELLGAALRLEQRPDQCIVFDNTPLSADVAHGVDMKSVSFVNHYARYELLTADLSVGYVADLELSSLVKLFDKREDLEPLLELDVDSGMQKYQRKAKTA